MRLMWVFAVPSDITSFSATYCRLRPRAISSSTSRSRGVSPCWRARGLTQSDLAEKCGLTDSAIRNYELGNRTPGEDQVKGIASALRVAPESLIDVLAATAREALELIFRIDEEFGLKPKEVGGELVLAIDPSSKKAPKLAQALKAWLAQIDSEKSGEITAEQLAEWKAKFGA